MARTIFFHLQLLKKLRLIATGSCNFSITGASCERTKMKLEKTFHRNSMTSERLDNTDIL